MGINIFEFIIFCKTNEKSWVVSCPNFSYDRNKVIDANNWREFPKYHFHQAVRINRIDWAYFSQRDFWQHFEEFIESKADFNVESIMEQVRINMESLYHDGNYGSHYRPRILKLSKHNITKYQLYKWQATELINLKREMDTMDITTLLKNNQYYCGWLNWASTSIFGGLVWWITSLQKQAEASILKYRKHEEQYNKLSRTMEIHEKIFDKLFELMNERVKEISSVQGVSDEEIYIVYDWY